VSKKTATAKEKSLPGKGGAPGLASSSKRNNAALQATSAKTQVSNANTSSGRSSRANNDTVGKADMKKKDAKGGGSSGGRGGGGGGGKTQGKSSATMAKTSSISPNASSTQRRSVPGNHMKGGGMASKSDEAMGENDPVMMNKKRKTMESDIITLEALAKARFHMQEYTKLVWQQAEDKAAEDAANQLGESSSAADLKDGMEEDQEFLEEDAEASDAAANDFEDAEELDQDEEDDQDNNEDDQDEEDEEDDDDGDNESD